MPSKVLIIGAGPSGTSCAASLVQLGHDVVVVDKAMFPRDKCCGDGLTTNALRLLEQLHFDPARVPDWQVCREIEIHSPSGRTIPLEFSHDGMFAAVAPRSQLDHALVQHCRALGVSIHEGCTFVSLTDSATDGVTVDIEGLGEISVDYVIAADGMWSPVRKFLGLSTPGYLGEWHAFRQYLGNVGGSASTTLHVWFEEDLLPGYAWSFPLPDGRVNFGIALLRTPNRSMQFMNDVWTELFSRAHIKESLGTDFVTEGRHTAWPIPARIDSAVRSCGRVLFVGDAVCATDTLTGEGIGQALETGMAAAQAIHDGATPAHVRSLYSKKIDSTLLADHKMSAFLSRVLAHPRVTRGVLAFVSANEWTHRNFVRWMFEDEPRAIIFTPRRWHRGLFARSGSYRAS